MTVRAAPARISAVIVARSVGDGITRGLRTSRRVQDGGREWVRWAMSEFMTNLPLS